jgi:hypothetical protein
MIETSEPIATKLIEAREIIWSGLATFATNPIFPAVTALLGAVTGAFVNQGAVDRRERAKAKKEVESVRILLRLEIDHNLSEFKKLLERLLNLDSDKSTEKDFYKIIEAIALHKTALNGLVSDIPKGLSTAEIRDTFRFYASVDRILQIKQKYFLEMTGEIQSDFTTQNWDEKAFDKVAKVVAEITSFIKEMLIQGNPLAKP